jgi:hypothetical protein
MLKASATNRGVGNGDGICEDEGALRDAFAGFQRALRYVWVRWTDLAVGGR